ncbi:MAG: hypothetical protein HC871_03845 [Rhizobiales bacterium]|nr:hypothetical protein [Hyphomicrobiales bacterium]
MIGERFARRHMEAALARVEENFGAAAVALKREEPANIEKAIAAGKFHGDICRRGSGANEFLFAEERQLKS